MSRTPGPEPVPAAPQPGDAEVAAVPARPEGGPLPRTAPDAAPVPGRGSRRRFVAGLVALAVGTLVLDQATKAWALATLEEGVRRPLLGDLLGLQLLFNPGAALGIATGTTWLLTVVAITVVVVIVRVARRLGSRGWTVALGLLLGGALGNLVDRMIRDPGVARGHVVDFIAYADWFVGNVADIAIVVAAGMLMLLSLLGIRLDGSREGRGEDEARRDGAPATGGAAGAPADLPGAPGTRADG
ncbi:signal peptidase II [Cellulomonas sp. C5510]|uniref:signal peptidase II n=1 Tax=Cellulomonas sp. C5510 TaxID=2871170 RepID=UPI001C98080F|nr:signal peptidase II [Cellulomonas sp. C5510]QZN84454.1 signal peptidase II [Cellulomonas sp. C5510]